MKKNKTAVLPEVAKMLAQDGVYVLTSSHSDKTFTVVVVSNGQAYSTCIDSALSAEGFIEGVKIQGPIIPHCDDEPLTSPSQAKTNN